MKYKVCFGVDGIPDESHGTITCGDSVEVVKRKVRR